jgi:FkbM family methyltransferase
MNAFSNIKEIANFPRAEFEAVCRANTFYVYLGNNTGLSQVLSKYKIYVDTRDAGVTPHLIMDGFWESWITQFMSTIINPGDVCIDAGANFGYYTILMAHLTGEAGRAIAVEPNPNLCRLLRFTSNLQERSFEIAEAALSDKSGRTTLHIPGNYFGGASLLKDKSKGFVIQKVKVPMLTMDQLVEQHGLKKVDMIKMDVEGFEPMVFNGMKKTIANNPQLKIIMEYTPVAYSDARGFTRFLCDTFKVQRIWGADHLEELSVPNINQMLEIEGHIDLFLSAR